MKKNNKGFSLVELIVVVLIMAIIATALTLAVTKYVAKSKRSSDAHTAGELKTAAETAVTDYLTTVDDLKTIKNDYFPLQIYDKFPIFPNFGAANAEKTLDFLC